MVINNKLHCLVCFIKSGNKDTILQTIYISINAVLSINAVDISIHQRILKKSDHAFHENIELFAALIIIRNVS